MSYISFLYIIVPISIIFFGLPRFATDLPSAFLFFQSAQRSKVALHKPEWGSTGERGLGQVGLGGEFTRIYFFMNNDFSEE